MYGTGYEMELFDQVFLYKYLFHRVLRQLKYNYHPKVYKMQKKLVHAELLKRNCRASMDNIFYTINSMKRYEGRTHAFLFYLDGDNRRQFCIAFPGKMFVCESKAKINLSINSMLKNYFFNDMFLHVYYEDYFKKIGFNETCLRLYTTVEDEVVRSITDTMILDNTSNTDDMDNGKVEKYVEVR